MATRGIKTRHRHLMRDLLRVLPHGKRGSKIATNGEQGLGELLQLCEESDCSEALLLDARDPAGRLYLWAATCPEGPSVLFRVVNEPPQSVPCDRRCRGSASSSTACCSGGGRKAARASPPRTVCS